MVKSSRGRLFLGWSMVSSLFVSVFFTTAVKKKPTAPTRDDLEDLSRVGCPGQGHSVMPPAGSR